ncbi:MAG: iron-sulfur cluster biosynthesis transcriptional regulator SufR [Thermostichales cyanobacterium GMQP_bins_62]
MVALPPVREGSKGTILHYLRKHGQGTAQELAQALGISKQAVRRHLKDLQGEGLIGFEAVAGGTGRPQHRYFLSPQGEKQFGDGYNQFATQLLDTLAATLGPEQVQGILQQQWQRRGLDYRQRLGSGSLLERLEKLVALRRQEGYLAEYRRMGDEPESYFLTEYHCAIADIAESFPTVCGHELEMFALALPDCTVERYHWMANGEHQCGYGIRKVDFDPSLGP